MTSPDPMLSFLTDAGANFIGGLAVEFVTGVLSAARPKVQRALQGEPQQLALRRAAGQALAAALSRFPLDEQPAEHYRLIFERWLDQPEVADELATLLDPREEGMDRAALRQAFEEACYDPARLVGVDFDEVLDLLVGGFAMAAGREPELIEPLKIKLLQEMAWCAEAMERLAGEQVAASKQAVDELAGIRRIAAEIEGGQDRTYELLQAILAVLTMVRDQGIASQQTAFQAVAVALGQAGYHIEMDHAVAVAVGDGATVRVAPELASIEALLRQIHDRLTTAPQALTQADLAEMEANYRQRVVEQFEFLTFEGISPTGTPIALPLEKVFVELKAVAEVPEAADTFSADERRLLLEAEGRGEAAAAELALHLDSLRLERWRREGRERETRLQRRSIGEIVADPTQRGLVILGDPGSGKTTLLRYLALVNAQKGLAVRDAGPRPLLPIFVPLAAYDECMRSNAACLPLGDFLALYFEKWRNLPGLGPLFAQALAEGRALVLLDGLDEVLDIGTRQYVA